MVMGHMQVGMPGALAVVDTRTYQLSAMHTFQPLQHTPPSQLAEQLLHVVTARGYDARHRLSPHQRVVNTHVLCIYYEGLFNHGTLCALFESTGKVAAFRARFSSSSLHFCPVLRLHVLTRTCPYNCSCAVTVLAMHTWLLVGGAVR